MFVNENLKKKKVKQQKNITVVDFTKSKKN